MSTATAEFYAIELKDYTSGNLGITSSDRIWDISKKVVDTIQMFMSARFQQPFGVRLESEKSVDLHTSVVSAKFQATSPTILF